MNPLSTMSCEKEILQRLNCKHLPVLPPDISRLIKSLTDDSVKFSQLADTIEIYPSIAARLIAIANSAWSSPMDEITSLEKACTRLGFNIVRSTSIALAVAAPFDPNRCPGFNAKRFWSTSLLAAEGATLLATSSTSTSIQPATARAAGMLHNLGLLLLADKLPIEVNESIKLVQKQEYIHLGDALQYMLGFNHCDAGRLLGQNWKLPEILIDAMAYGIVEENSLEQSSETADLIRLTASMVSSLQQDRLWPTSEDSLEKLQITSADAIKVFERLSNQLEKTQKMADMLFTV